MSESTSSSGESEGLNLVEIVRALRSDWKLIGVLTFICILVGVAYAFLATPVYRAQAIIAPRDYDQGGNTSRMLAQFGGAAAMVGSQLGVGNNGVAKLEVILKSREVADSVVRKYDLLPVLFPRKWDKAAARWKVKNPRKIPSVRDGVERMLLKVLNVSVNEKKGLVTLEVGIQDSVMAKKIVDAYLVELGDKIRREVTTDADMNRQYLEQQIINTHDPVVLEKIQGMIAFEIEKSMLVSYQAFEVLSKPSFPYQRSRPKRKFVVGLSTVIGLLASCGGVLAWRRTKGFRDALRVT